MTIAEREDKQTLETNLKLLANITREIQQNNSRGFLPLYPRVLVYVCERAQQVGSLVLPEKQNKTVLEGIVLATWKPFTKTHHRVDAEGNEHEVRVYHASEVQPGDHVLFPHHAGLPEGNILPDTHFRIISENEEAVGAGRVPGILAIVQYAEAGRKQRLQAQLEHIVYHGTPNPNMIQRLMETLERDFVLVDRHEPSVTLSGV